MPGDAKRGLVVASCSLLVAGCALTSTSGGDDAAAPERTLAPLAAVQTLTLDGRRIATRCAGDGESQPVLLVAGHGVPMEQAWDPVQRAIGGFARVCAYDRLGVGGSDYPPRRQTFADLADELDAVLAELGMDRPVLVAAGLGGMVAMSWAELNADRTAGVVLVDATPPGYAETVFERLPERSGARGGKLRDGFERLLRPKRNVERLDATAELTGDAVFSPVGTVPVVALTHSISDMAKDLRPGDAAALDSAWTGGQQQWAELSTLGRVERVDLAGHDIHLDQPQAVVAATREIVTAAAAD